MKKGCEEAQYELHGIEQESIHDKQIAQNRVKEADKEMMEAYNIIGFGELASKMKDNAVEKASKQITFA